MDMTLENCLKSAQNITVPLKKRANATLDKLKYGNALISKLNELAEILDITLGSFKDELQHLRAA